VRARFVVPLVALCALVAATPALADPHLSKAQNRVVANLIERWVNDVVRGQNLADGWKIAGAAERGGITHKAWLSGRELPLLQMRVRNNPRTAWYVTGKSGNEIFLVVSLMTGRGKNKAMYDNQTTLQKRHGRWYVYTFLTDGIFRLGPGHSGSGVGSKNKVTGMADYAAGGRAGGDGGATEGRIGHSWGMVVVGGFLGLPFIAVLAFVLVALVRSRQSRRARIAYDSSRAT